MNLGDTKKQIAAIVTTILFGFILWAIYLFFTYHKPDDKDKVKLSVSSYIKSNLKNPDTYEPISFGNIGKSDSLQGGFTIRHTFKANKGDKSPSQTTQIFEMDSSY